MKGAVLLLVSVVTLLLPAAAAAQGNPIVPPPVPAPNVTVRNEVTVQAPPPDPAVIADASVQSSEAILVSVIVPPPLGWANSLLDLPDLWRTTPPDLTYGNSQVRGLADQLRTVAFGLIALAIFAMGASHALGHPLEWGRLLFAVVLSLGNLVWWQIGIDLNNTINNSLSAPDLPSLVRPHLQMPPNPAEEVGAVVLTLAYAVVALLLLFSLLFRLGLIEILIAVGSLALLCYAVEQSEALAQTYARLSVGLLFSQVLIVLGLKLAAVLSGIGTGLGGALIGIVVLLLIRSLPGMLMSVPRGASGGGRVVMLGLLLRRLVARF